MRRAALISLACGLAGFALLGVTARHDAQRAATSYLVAFAFAVSIPLGALAWLAVCDACGAVWFIPLRRVGEGLTATLPALALLFVPLAACLPVIYPWARPLAGSGHAAELMAGRQAYLAPPGFVLRSCACFACWIILAELMRRSSLRREREGAPDRSAARRTLASIALPLLALTVTVASIDWYLSLDPTWSSTIYGLLHLSGAATGGLCAWILACRWMARRGLLPAEVGADHAHALGNLLLTAVMLWFYLAFMQYLVVWMADLPDEAAWYVIRLDAGWWALALAVLLLHGAVPMTLLFVRAVKRQPRTLAAVAALLLIAHYLDLVWQLAPAVAPGAWAPGVSDVAALAAVLGCAAALGLWRARGLAAIPRNDPDLADGIAYRSRA